MSAYAIPAVRWQRSAVFPIADAKAILLVIIVVCVIRAMWFGDPVVSMDENLYALIGSKLADGYLPFSDYWDRKPFGLFAIFAFSDFLPGPWSADSPIRYQIVGTLFTLAGSLLLYCLARPLVDRVTAASAAMLYPVLMASYGNASGQSEVFHVPIMLGMVWLLHDKRKFAVRKAAITRVIVAMLLGGIALQIKYTVLPQCIYLGLFGLWRLRIHFRGWLDFVTVAGAMVLTGLLPTIAVAGIYIGAGETQAFVYANFQSFFERESLGRFHPKNIPGMLPMAALLATGWYAAHRLNPPAKPSLYLFYTGYAVAGIATVMLPGTLYLYYLAALVPAALLVSLPLLDRTGPLRWAPLAFVGAILLVMWNPIEELTQSKIQRENFAALTEAVAPYVDGSENCLWVHDGPTALYKSTGSCLPTRYIYADHLNNGLERNSIGVSQNAEVERVLANRPTVIVTTRQLVVWHNRDVAATVRRAIENDYRLAADRPFGKRNFQVWVRRDI